MRNRSGLQRGSRNSTLRLPLVQRMSTRRADPFCYAKIPTRRKRQLEPDQSQASNPGCDARRGVIVYTVSTSESSSDSLAPSAGDHALKVLSEQSGGSAFVPDSLSSLNRSLAELQQVIRSRYLISYKPARFRPDGRYRAIDIQAQKSGRKLRVYARKGYYSRVDGAAGEEN